MLTEEEIGKLRATLATSGWNDVISPALMNRGRFALKALALDPSEREKAGGDFKNTDDATLRAILRECEWMQAVWRNEIAVFEHNRRNDELARQQQNGVEAPA